MCKSASLFMFFLFQAEDGIQDTSVTGVQTCALPIYRKRRLLDQNFSAPRPILAINSIPMSQTPNVQSKRVDLVAYFDSLAATRDKWIERNWYYQIGRASCRERMYISVS